MTVLERPYDFNWSKNDLRYVFQLEDLLATNVTAQVKLFYADNNSSSFTEIVTLSDLKPTDGGFVFLYLQQYLNSVLNYDVPDGSVFALAASHQTKKFYVEYREVNDDNTDADWISDDDNIRCVLKGGIEKLKHSGNNFFLNYQQVNKTFLTWLPSKRFVYIDQLTFLCFFNSTGTDSTGFKLKFAFKDVAGSDYAYVHTFTESQILFHLTVSPANDAYPAFADDLWYYDVQVTDADDNALTETYRFYVEYRPVYESWDLFWHGSLGGFDGARVMGETLISIDRSSEETGAGKDVNDWVDKIRAGNITNTAIVKRNTFKGDIGFQKSRQENEALQEVLLSESIYQLLTDLWLPVLIIGKTQDLRTTKDRKFSFPIDWQLAGEEDVFTPQARNFGIGEGGIIVNNIPIDFYWITSVDRGDGSSDVTFAFTEPYPPGITYTLEYFNVTDSTTRYQDIGGASPRTLVLENDHTYQVRVRADNGAYSSDWSGYVGVTPG